MHNIQGVVGIKTFSSLLVFGAALEGGCGSRSADDFDTSSLRAQSSSPLPMGVGRSPETQGGPPTFAKPNSRQLKVPQSRLDAQRVTAQLALVASPIMDQKVLVISADGKEVDLPAIKQSLDYLGTPYTLWTAQANPGAFTADRLYQGSHSFYQAVILTTSNLVYETNGEYLSALSPTEWQTLTDYEGAFRIRQVTYYSYPTVDLGFATVPTAVSPTAQDPLYATLTADGAQTFGYLNPKATLPIQYAYTYLATADSSVIPILTDGNGHALGVIKTYGDGRENLALTFDGAPYLVHSEGLAYGIVNWVTRGLFLGERHVYVGPQEDDILLDNDMYFGGTYRLTGDDWRQFVAWQSARQQVAVTKNLLIAHAFNGEGYARRGDSLTNEILLTQGQFNWISHTYSHLNLDEPTTYDETYDELQQNLKVAKALALTSFNRRSLVTPDVSGLNNPGAMGALWDFGVRYVVSDSSRQDNPSPNAGIYNQLQPGILMVPRRPTNLFYNVSFPAEWVAEYNQWYANFWGHAVTYDELLDKESDVLLRYLLKGETDPWMFHQGNLRAYDGQHSLLGDLLDRTIAKYSALYTLPVASLNLYELGQRMAARMAYNDAGISAQISSNGTVLSISAQKDALVPVTGISTGSYETYGSQHISYIRVGAGHTVAVTIVR